MLRAGLFRENRSHGPLDYKEAGLASGHLQLGTDNPRNYASLVSERGYER